MTEEEEDKLKKRKKYLKKCLEKIGFPYTKLKNLDYDINFLLNVLEEILDIDSEKNQSERLVINDREKSKIENYRSNFFFNFLKSSDEKNLNHFLQELLKKYDYKKYKTIEFDERGNIYSKEKISDEDFIIKIERFFDYSQKLQEELINEIFSGTRLHNLDKLINNLKENAIFDNGTEDDSKKILRIFIIFVYWKWQTMLLENIINSYKKGLDKVEDYLKNRTLEEKPSEILSLNALSKFLNRNKKNKRDTKLEEKLKKIYIFTDRELKDYSLKDNYPIYKYEIEVLDSIFQNIFFSDEKILGHKLEYYLEVYRENCIVDKIEKIIILNNIIYSNKDIEIQENLIREVLKIYNEFYTTNELKKFNRLKKEKEKNENKLQNRNLKNKNKYVEKIYKILISNKITDDLKINLIKNLLKKFKIENRYVKSEILKEGYFENIKPLNRVIDTYLSILLNIHPHYTENLKKELLEIIYLLEEFKKIKPKLIKKNDNYIL